MTSQLGHAPGAYHVRSKSGWDVAQLCGGTPRPTPRHASQLQARHDRLHLPLSDVKFVLNLAHSHYSRYSREGFPTKEQDIQDKSTFSQGRSLPCIVPCLDWVFALPTRAFSMNLIFSIVVIRIRLLYPVLSMSRY